MYRVRSTYTGWDGRQVKSFDDVVWPGSPAADAFDRGEFVYTFDTPSVRVRLEVIR